jgi:hypothetical protein
MNSPVCWTVVLIAVMLGMARFVSAQTQANTSAPSPLAGSCAKIAETQDDIQPVQGAPTSYYSVRTINGKWTFFDPHGRPFYSVGVNTVSMDGDADPHGVNLYKDTVTAKYGTEEAWAAAQQKRFQEWGINTIAAFSNVGPFLSGDIPFTVFIETAGSDTDYWDPGWEETATSAISEAAHRYRDNKNVLGYFIDNELSWIVDLQALFRPGSELLVMGRYFHYPHARTELLAFLKSRYRSVDDLRADFPAAKLPGTDWATLNWSDVTLGARATPHGQETLDAWAEILARRYFAVTTGALRASDPKHLNLGSKFIAGLTPVSVLKVAASYADVISADFYDLAPPATEKGKSSPDYLSLLAALIPMNKIVPNRDMLADWYRLTNKPVLIAEFGYRAEDSGLPNTFPPVMVTLPNQKARAQAVTNYANCAINAPYIVGLHFFELFDEPAAGRVDGENSNWGLVSGKDVPYTEVGSALAAASQLASHRLDLSYKPAPCTPVGVHNIDEYTKR